MASSRMQFILDGRDHLSRVLDRAGDNADRLGRRLLAASINGDAAMRRLSSTTTTRMAGLQRDTDLGEKALDALKGTLISLAPAAIPAAASLAPIAAGAGAAAVAVAAFGAALGPQIAGLTEAGEAEKKWQAAIEDGGEASQAAVDAQLAYQTALMKLPPASQTAALALSSLKDEYKGWSDALAADTMPVFTKGLAVLGGLLPKTTGLVKGASVQLDRMMTVVAGGMESPGLDRLNQKFTAFATGTLQKVNDQLVHLMRTSDAGKIGGGLSEFMDYAHAQGPVVADTLRNVGTALANVLRAGSDVGVGMLDLVNALSGIVAAIPPGAVAAMLQLAVAIKAVRLAAVGMAAARTAMAAVGTQLLAMQAAAAAAPGRLSAVTAAIGSLSRGAKVALAGTGIGLLVIALGSLASMGKKAPPDVDRLTTSLGKLGDTGKVTGEAAKAFGADLGGLADSLRILSRPSNLDATQQFLTSLIGMDSTPVKEAKQDLEAVDKALAGLVQGGKSDIAAAAFDKLAAGMKKNGMSAGELRDKLDGYKSALADQAFEQQLAAASMGLFGAQAQQVQAKLDAQKASADGLAQSINALSNAVLTARGGIRGMEAAIDAADAAFKKNGKTLDENTAKGRGNNQALDDIAASTIKAAEGARANGASWATVNGIYDRGHAKILRLTEGVTGNERAAKKLADQILRTPDKTARLKGNLEDLQTKLADAKSRLAKAPSSKTTALKGEISDLQRKIAQAKTDLAGVQSKTVSVMVQYRTSKNPSSFAASIGGYATGGRPTPGEWAWVGEQGPELVQFKGGETVYDHGTSMGMTSPLAAAGQDAGRGLSAGMVGSTAGVEASARRMAAAVTAGVRAELEIASPSKKMKALMADVGKGIIIGLTGTKAKISATAKDLVKDIWKAWEGVKTNKDSALVAMVNRDTKKLQSLATSRDKLAAKIVAAKTYRSELTSNAKAAAGLSSLGMADEEVTAGGIQAGLQQKLAKINQFARYIQSLAKRGLNKSLLQQVLNMGPDEGYAYASALAGMGTGALRAVNATQANLDKAAGTLGASGADAMYDSGKAAGKGFLTGLESQQKAIEDQMVKIAKGMQKAIKKALGIKSPSRVMAQLGRYSTEGLAVGLTERMPMLDRALGAVTDRVASAQPVIGRPAVVGGGSGSRPVQIQIDVHGAMDPVAVGRELQRVLLQLKRTQGVNVQLGVG
ncbi:hypothetical protein [Streptomyces sp. NBC_00842]|uniref:hypothetical protein n=1 Tax=Streptomyces sp. NBC_00842 TaxID=2975848 RepID=UPI00386E1E72|nr:hypothetical protein OH821_17180 [Streptomyces sp. NBC_00842]